MYEILTKFANLVFECNKPQILYEVYSHIPTAHCNVKFLNMVKGKNITKHHILILYLLENKLLSRNKRPWKISAYGPCNHFDLENIQIT